MEHIKIMQLKELEYTIKAGNIGIGAKVLGYENIEIEKPRIMKETKFIDGKYVTISKIIQGTEDRYEVRMEKLDKTLTEYGNITEEVYNTIVEAYYKLMDNNIYNVDSHEENVMFDSNGNVRIVDYGCCYTKEEIMNNPNVLSDWFEVEVKDGEEIIAYYKENIRKYFKMFLLA